jgi:type II secretory ATPase GspE/PulE/Tfp pilus assembly ATPase PilB-like protein
MENNKIAMARRIDSLPDFPDGLKDFAVINKENFSVYIERKKASAPVFLTWISRCKMQSVSWKVVPSDMDVIANMRGQGLSTTVSQDHHEDISKEVMGQAVELLRMASSYGASDIHMLVRKNLGEIQFRVKGDLKVFRRTTSSEVSELIRSLYQGVASVRDASFNELESQNAQISGDVVAGMKVSSVRIIRGPCYPVDAGGQFAVLRMQYEAGHKTQPMPKLENPRRPEGALKLNKFGFNPLQMELLMAMIDAPSGIIMFTGPTGSGKTTSLAEILTHMARKWPEKRQVTIEDPVEYPYPWGVQLVVANASSEAETGEAFNAKLRISLRMDPDIILMGELRGAESAIAALGAAMTGHVVLTTMHTNDAYSAIDRMELMDPVRLNRGVTCDSKTIRGIVSQRLVPRLCHHCSVPHEQAVLSDEDEAEKDHLLALLSTYGDTSRVRYKGSGCSHCDYDGVTGRVAIAEVVLTDSQLMEDMVKLGKNVARRNHRARTDTDQSMMVNAVKNCLDGLIDPREISKRVDHLCANGEEDK